MQDNVVALCPLCVLINRESRVSALGWIEFDGDLCVQAFFDPGFEQFRLRGIDVATSARNEQNFERFRFVLLRCVLRQGKAENGDKKGDGQQWFNNWFHENGYVRYAGAGDGDGVRAVGTIADVSFAGGGDLVETPSASIPFEPV